MTAGINATRQPKKIKSNPRDGRSLFALNATHQAYAPNWATQIGIAVILRPDRQRLAEPETKMLLMLIEQTFVDAQRLATKRPLMFEFPRGRTKDQAMREQALSILQWTKSHQPFGLLWVADVLKSTSDIWIQPERLADTLAKMIEPCLKRVRSKRNIAIASLAGREAVEA